MVFGIEKGGVSAAITAALMGLWLVAAAPSAAYGAPGDIKQAENGGTDVELPGGKHKVITRGTVDRLRSAIRMDSDDDTERSLTAIFRQIPPNDIPAASMAAASFAPDRAPVIAAAAIRANEAQGVKAARGMGYVRGVRKRHILLGAHASGNRGAYRKLKGEKTDRPGGPVGGSMGPASLSRGGSNVVPFTPEERRKTLPFR
ncbi:MAG: hypothetical protein ACPG06_06760 [Alphaproteobacteria bacterium]